MGNKNHADKAKVTFNGFFEDIYGGRWPALKAALIEAPTKTVSLVHSSTPNAKLLKDNLYILEGESREAYSLDLASVICTLDLPITEEMSVLDLCSAPGGKSLSLLYRANSAGRWDLNDLSESRLVRTKRVFKEFSSIYGTEALRFFKRDGSLWGRYQPGEYDIVILDEINVTLLFNLLRWEEVKAMLQAKPEHVEVICTGRGAPQELIEYADLVTEMKDIKHYYDIGVLARRGIEN